MSSVRYVRFAVFFLAVLAAPVIAKSKVEGSISLKGKSKTEYSSLAKISLQEAIAIATKQGSGKIVEAALEKEDGFLIYEVEVLTADSGRKEFLIDAGTGSVLHVNDSSAKEDEEND